MNYEKRTVAFIDILGFKDLVKTQSCDRITKAIDILNEFTSDSVKIDGKTIKTSQSRYITQFSDSIVLSSLANEPGAVFNTLYDLQLTVAQLLHHGFLCRGGICVGNIIHNEKYLFGPAMIKAYEMESKKSKNPRIIIDENVLQIGQEIHAKHHSSGQEKSFIMDVISQDKDQLYYIDYFRKVFSELEDEQHATKYIGCIFDALKKLANAVQNEADAIIRANLTQKHNWLAEKYNRLIFGFSKGPYECFSNGETTNSKSFQRYLQSLAQVNKLP